MMTALAIIGTETGTHKELRSLLTRFFKSSVMELLYKFYDTIYGVSSSLLLRVKTRLGF